MVRGDSAAQVNGQLRERLLELANRFDDLAFAGLAAVASEGCSPNVAGLLAAAAVLRAEADEVAAGASSTSAPFGTPTGEASADPTGPKVAPHVHDVLPQNEGFLRDVFGRRLFDGACVLDADGQVGYVRLEYGTPRGPDSLYWDGWFSVTRSRRDHLLAGKPAHGGMVQLIGAGS